MDIRIRESDGFYYTNSDLFFRVGAVGRTPEDAIERTKVLFLRLREVCFTKLLEEYGIQKSEPI